MQNELFRSTKCKRDVNDRTGIIGGSTAGAVLGLSTYQSEYEAWQTFMGEVREVSDETQSIFDMGHALEDFIAKQAERIYNIKLQKSNYAYVNNLHPYLICHPDRLLVGKRDGLKVGVEIKSSSAFDNKRWGDEDTDQIPYDYLCQVYMYFICGVCDEVWLFRFANNRLTRYIIKYDEKRALKIMDLLVDWVEKVKRGYIPAPRSYKEATERWNAQPEGDLLADDGLESTAVKLLSIKSNIKALEKEADELKALIVEALDGKQRLISSTGDILCKYTQVKSNRFDSKAFKADHQDLYEEYCNETTSMRFI